MDAYVENECNERPPAAIHSPRATATVTAAARSRPVRSMNSSTGATTGFSTIAHPSTAPDSAGRSRSRHTSASSRNSSGSTVPSVSDRSVKADRATGAATLSRRTPSSSRPAARAAAQAKSYTIRG